MSPDNAEIPVEIWEYDLVFRDVQLDFLSYLQDCLWVGSKSADGISWLSFEGSFNFDHLFTEYVAHQVYGYCIIGSDPVVVWDRDKLHHEDWMLSVRSLKCEAEQMFRQDDLEE